MKVLVVILAALVLFAEAIPGVAQEMPQTEVVCRSPGMSDMLFREGEVLFLGDPQWSSLRAELPPIDGVIESAEGADWTVMEECGIVFLYPGEGRVVAVFVPETFPFRSVYLPPLMGAKSILFRDQLPVEADGVGIDIGN